MDDLVVIFLTLIFIIAGLFGQRKKRQAEAEKKSGHQPSADDLWEMRDQDWEEPQVFVEGNEYPKMKPEPAVGHAFNPEKEGERTLVTTPRKETLADEAGKTEEKVKFSLRDAVIYSEILNRKYI